MMHEATFFLCLMLIAIGWVIGLAFDVHGAPTALLLALAAVVMTAINGGIR